MKAKQKLTTTEHYKMSVLFKDSSYKPISMNELKHDDDDDEMMMDDIYLARDRTIVEANNDGGDNVYQEAVSFEIDEHDLEQHAEQEYAAQHNGPPTNYICPLTLHVMDEPVSDGCGHCFEREAIVEWLEYHELCPISRKPLLVQELLPSFGLGERIQQWRTGHPEQEEVTSISESDTQHSQLELMLLPQERKVLQIIKLRAKDKRKSQEHNKCICIIAGVATLFLVVGTGMAIKFLEDFELIGPI